ncbi:MAG: hypothetical protein H6603_10215 [Flavobacteriales bacterium]|nr:hypothetical protein [Flavobacteriales bacterium]
MKTKLLTFLMAIGSVYIVTGQNCNLSEDRKDAYGKILRTQEWMHADSYGNYLGLLLSRNGDRYEFLLDLDQPMNSGNTVNFTLDGDEHPVMFMLASGATVKGYLSKSGSYASKSSGGKVKFSETYAIPSQNMIAFEGTYVTDIVFRCSGRVIGTGNARNEIRFPLSLSEGTELAGIMQCLAREEKTAPQELQIAPPTRKTTKPSTDNDGQEKLLRELITTVGEGTKDIKKSVEQSGTSQLEMNHLLVEKLENLTTAIDRLNNSKEEEKTKEEFVPRVFGFGVYFKTNYLFGETQLTTQTTNDEFDGTNLSFSDYSTANRFMNGTSINMSFNAGMRKKLGFRFEPFVDFVVFNAKSETDVSTTKTSARQVETGLRLLFIVRRGRVNIYPGLTGGYVNQFRSQRISYKTSGSWQSGEGLRNGGNLGLVLGGEYLITPNFGIRVESGLLYYILGQTKLKSKDSTGSSASQSVKYTSGLFGSYARLGASFYF